MPWTGKFQEALNGALNPKRTMARLLKFYGRDVKAHTLNGPLNLFARVEPGGLGIRRPPGIEPGWTHYQQSLAHHLRHKILDAVSATRTLGPELNVMLDLPEDFEFPIEQPDIPVRNVYATPKPPARASARWNRSFPKWSTQWSLVPITQPCRQNEYRLRDLPSDEPTFLSYQLPWEPTYGQRYFHRLPKGDLKEARKCSGRLADPEFFPYEPRRVVSPHEILEHKSLLEGRFQVLGWEEGEYKALFDTRLGGHSAFQLVRASRLVVDVLHSPRW